MHIATRDRITAGSAIELLQTSIDGFGDPGAAWRAGHRVMGALRPVREAIPFLGEALTAHPFLTAEAERVARTLGLLEVRWYHAFEDNGRVLYALTRGADLLRRGRGDPVALRDGLREAAAIDLFGRRPEQRLVLELSGRSRGHACSRVGVVRAGSTYDATAAVAAVAVSAVLEGAIPPGGHWAGSVLALSSLESVAALCRDLSIEILEQPLAAYVEVEDGVV